MQYGKMIPLMSDRGENTLDVRRYLLAWLRKRPILSVGRNKWLYSTNVVISTS